MIKSNSEPIENERQMRRLSSISTCRIGIHSKCARTAWALRWSTLMPPARTKEDSVLFMSKEPAFQALFATSRHQISSAIGGPGEGG